MKKLSIIAACLALIGLLGGCGSKFDASGYVKALLDNSYKNDSTQFVSMKIGTADEAAKLYEQGLNAEADAMLEMVGGVSEEKTQEIKDVFANILAGAKYTVGEAEKQDDKSYVVTVKYEQMQVFGPAAEAYMEDVIDMRDEWTAAAMAGEEIPSEDEMVAAVIDSLIDCFNEYSQNATYAGPETTTIRIELVDNVYTPNQSDLLNLETVLFDIDALNETIQQYQ